MSAWTFIGPVLGGLVSSSALWFTFSRTLVTRKEMEEAIDRAIQPLHARQDRNDNVVDGLRDDMVRLRESIVKLTTVLEQLAK